MYGAAGSVVVFLIWVYYSAWIVLFGAHFVRIYTERYGRLNRAVPLYDDAFHHMKLEAVGERL